MVLKRRILFIEDHKDTRQLVTFVLEASDYSVTSATTVAAALQLARAENFAFTFSTIGFPMAMALNYAS